MTKILQIISKYSRISVFSFPYIVVPTLQYIKADLVKKRVVFSQVWKVDLERQHFLCHSKQLWRRSCELKIKLLFSSQFWGRCCKMTFSIKVLRRSCKITCGFHTHLGVFFHKSRVIVFTHIIKRILWKNVAFTNFVTVTVYLGKCHCRVEYWRVRSVKQFWCKLLLTTTFTSLIQTFREYDWTAVSFS